MSEYSLELTGYLSISEQDESPLELTGYLSIPERSGTKYDGSYEVIPTGEFQLLPTSECYLVDDVIVHPIPYSEVSNEYGGVTVTIGE